MNTAVMNCSAKLNITVSSLWWKTHSPDQYLQKTLDMYQYVKNTAYVYHATVW